MNRLLAFLLIFFLLLPLPLSAQDSGALGLREEMMQAERLPVEPGDRCIVCGVPLSADDIVLSVRGRRVPISSKQAMWDELLSDPLRYFSTLQPRGALFSEGAEKPEAKFGWFIFGIVIVALVISGALAGAGAIRRGLNPLKWFLQGLFGNVLASLLVRNQGSEVKLPDGATKVPLTAEPIACAKCGAENHPSARACSLCGENLQPMYKSEVENL